MPLRRPLLEVRFILEQESRKGFNPVLAPGRAVTDKKVQLRRQCKLSRLKQTRSAITCSS